VFKLGIGNGLVLSYRDDMILGEKVKGQGIWLGLETYFMRSSGRREFALYEYILVGVVFVGVWIATSGTVHDDVARHIGEGLRACKQQDGNTDLVLFGFANLRDIKHSDKIRQQSHNISIADQKVFICLSRD